MTRTANYIRYYFPSGLRWTLSVLILPLVIYLTVIGWYVLAIFCLIIVVALWTSKYVISIDLNQKVISDCFYKLAIPFGKNYKFNELEALVVTTKKRKYKAASRSRDYWVNYTEYTLNLKYDGKELDLFTLIDHNQFKVEVEKLAKELNLSVESTSY